MLRIPSLDEDMLSNYYQQCPKNCHCPSRQQNNALAPSCRTSTTRSSCGRASEYAIDLGGHDEVVLMQSLDLLGLQRDRRIAPTEADIWMMAFSFRQFTNLLNKGKCLPKITKPEAPLDAVSFLHQLPVWRLCMKELSFLARERSNSPATGNT